MAKNPKSFENWALNNNYSDNFTIDRINEDKDYEPSNCRWVTLKDNAKYKSTTKILTVGNISHTGRDWSKILGFGINTINTILKENGQEKAKELIKRRLKDPYKKRKSKQTWLNVYDIS